MESMSIFAHQVAGQRLIFCKQGAIYKPAIANEEEFYRCVIKLVPQLIPFIPNYLGMIEIDTVQEEQKESAPWVKVLIEKTMKDQCNRFILLEDLTKNMKYPCLIDIKLGIRQ